MHSCTAEHVCTLQVDMGRPFQGFQGSILITTLGRPLKPKVARESQLARWNILYASCQPQDRGHALENAKKHVITAKVNRDFSSNGSFVLVEQVLTVNNPRWWLL